MLNSETHNTFTDPISEDLPKEFIIDVDDFSNAEEAFPTGIMSTQEIVANVRESQIYELKNIRNPRY